MEVVAVKVLVVVAAVKVLTVVVIVVVKVVTVVVKVVAVVVIVVEVVVLVVVVAAAAGVKVVVVVAAAAAAVCYKKSIVDTNILYLFILQCPCLYPIITAWHSSRIWESSLPVKAFERFELNCTTLCANKHPVPVG